MKINSLEVVNVKKVRAVTVQPSASGLTVIGGHNAQGKTSVLDAIVWALGGNKYKPSSPQREGSMATPVIRIELDNGVVVERSGKNASLKVTDTNGNKAGQSLLDELISQLALDLPRFLSASGKEKADVLLQIIGVGRQLHELDSQEKKLYDERHAVGLVVTRKQKHAEDLPFEANTPDDEVSAMELIQQQQAILATNGENQRLRNAAKQLRVDHDAIVVEVERLEKELESAKAMLGKITTGLIVANKTASQLQDESTAELEESLLQIDDTNRRVRINRTKAAAKTEASEMREQVDELTGQLTDVRQERQRLLDGAELPLPGLSVTDGELTYNGQAWDCMSSAEQLRVAVAVVRKLRPECGFVLLDKTEQMDVETLTEFGKWIEDEGLQVIATRVSTGDECSIIIEDGLVAGESAIAKEDSF